MIRNNRIICEDNGNIEDDCNEATIPPPPTTPPTTPPPPPKHCKHIEAHRLDGGYNHN